MTRRNMTRPIATIGALMALLVAAMVWWVGDAAPAEAQGDSPAVTSPQFSPGVDPGTAQLWWDPPVHLPPTFTHYVVVYQDSEGDNQSVNTTGSSIPVSGLTLNSATSVSITVRYATTGETTWSPAVYLDVTPQSTVPPPQNLRVKGGAALGSLRADWMPPEGSSFTYTYSARVVGESGSTSTTTDAWATFTGLELGNQRRVCVLASYDSADSAEVCANGITANHASGSGAGITMKGWLSGEKGAPGVYAGGPTITIIVVIAVIVGLGLALRGHRAAGIITLVGVAATFMGLAAFGYGNAMAALVIFLVSGGFVLLVARFR